MTSRRYVTLDVDVAEVLSDVSDAELRSLCADRGIVAIDPDATPKGRDDDAPVVLSRWELDEVLVRLRRRDPEGALLALERALPRDFRGIYTLLDRAFRCGPPS